MEYHRDERSWSSLPQGVLQVVAGFLTRRDCLTARLVCRHWSIALAPAIKQLRVHIAAGCSSTAVGGEEAGQLLQQALVQMQFVDSVELVLTNHTTASDLEGALRVIGSQETIQRVIIEELTTGGSSAQQPRDYAGHLQLSKLQHVRDLIIQSPMTWSLQDVWEQVCLREAVGNPGGADNHPAPLQSLTVQRTSAASPGLVCIVPCDVLAGTALADTSARISAEPPAARTVVLHGLQHLTTPLPGQHFKEGAVACTIGHSHTQYIKGVAAMAPNLESLAVLGHYQGDPLAFKEFKHLAKLDVCIGGLLRSMSDLFEEESAITKPIMSNSQLQLLDLTGAEGMMLPVKLEWLTEAPRLQHLTACIVRSSQDIAKVRPDQLRSLCALHVEHSPELLSQIAAVGQGLTSLTLSKEGEDAFATRTVHKFYYNPISLQRHLTSFSNLHSLSILSGEKHLGFTVPNPAKVWAALPQLSCLKLQGIGLGYTPKGEPSSSRAISEVMGRDSTEAAILRLQRRVDNCLVLWLGDLPKGLQQLELSRYLVVMPCCGNSRPKLHGTKPDGLQTLVLSDCFPVVVKSSIDHLDAIAADAAVGSDADEWAPCDRITARAPVGQLLQLLSWHHQLQDLQLLRVPVCAADVVALSQVSRQLQRLRICPIAWGELNHSDRVELAAGVVKSLADAAEEGLFQHLTHLELDFNMALAQYVYRYRCYEGIEWPGQDVAHEGCGVAALRALCSSMPASGLRQLRFAMDMVHLEEWGSGVAHALRCVKCGTAPSDATRTDNLVTLIDGGYGCTLVHSPMTNLSVSELQGSLCTCNGPWELGNWQHLRCLEVKLLMPSDKRWRDLGWGHLGRCRACGGGLGIQAVMWYLQQVAPSMLPTCELSVSTDKAGEDSYGCTDPQNQFLLNS